jgi:hypothetical protein
MQQSQALVTVVIVPEMGAVDVTVSRAPSGNTSAGPRHSIPKKRLPCMFGIVS